MKRIYVLATIIVTMQLIFYFSQAAVLPEYCSDSGINKVNLPVFPKESRSDSFLYSYRVTPGRLVEAPTVIFIPGGPGGISMMQNQMGTNNFTLITTDPRSLGCNANEAAFAADEALNSELVAQDIVGMIKAEQLNDYILWGISYGTLVATLVAQKAELGEIPRPRAMVLDGTLGRSFLDGEYTTAYIEEWNSARRLLPREIAAKLESEPLPYGFSAAAWGAFIQSKIIMGTRPFDASKSASGNAIADRFIDNFNPMSMWYDGFSSVVPDALKDRSSKEQLRFHRLVTCQEIAADTRGHSNDFVLKAGALVPLPTGYCGNLALVHPYDSASVHLRIPIFYFSGDADPATPRFQALYHANNQRYAKTYLISLAGGGHGSLFSGVLRDCGHTFFESLLDVGLTDKVEFFQKAFEGCRTKGIKVNGAEVF